MRKKADIFETPMSGVLESEREHIERVLARLRKRQPVILVYVRFDETTLRVVMPPEWARAIESRALPGSLLHELPIYETDLSNSSHFPFSGVGSLLLSDIAGFSTTALEVSPLDVIEIMGRILELERRCIQESGGFMPYTGVGEVMLAVWGSSSSSRSHAELAVATGRKILAELRMVQADTGFSFPVRIAVTTGKMTVDSIGGRPQVVGAPFTTAKRLFELPVARRSHLLCTSETLEFISARPPSDSIATVRGCSGQDVSVFEFT